MTVAELGSIFYAERDNVDSVWLVSKQDTFGPDKTQ